MIKSVSIEIVTEFLVVACAMLPACAADVGIA